MKGVPFLIAAVAIAAALLIRRARGGQSSPPPVVRLFRRFRRFGGRAPLGDTGLVAGREIRERLRGRFFRFITLALLVLVAAAIVIPTIGSGNQKPQRVGVVGTPSTTLDKQIEAAAKSVGATEQLVPVADVAAARSDLRNGQLDLAVVDGRSVLVDQQLAPNDTSKQAQFVRSLAGVLGVTEAFRAAGLSPTQAATVAGARPVPVESVQTPRGESTSRSTSVIGVILVFVMLTQYNTWTLMGVMEEKSSRVVEVLLATVRPIQLLAGKVLGIGLVAVAQAGLIVGVALITAAAVGSSLLKGTAPLVVVATLIWLVLGYAFYSWVYAAAGSMAERQDQVQSMVLPLSAPIIFGYIVGLTAAGSANPSLLVRVLAFLPPTAPFAMPVLVALDATSWWAFALSALVTLASTVVVARLAAGVYRRAVLRTGGRVRLREILAATGARPS